MKLIKTLINFVSLVIIVIISYFVWNFLQKQEIIITNTTKSIITQLREVSKLETAEMTITKIMEAKKDLIDVIPSMSFDNIIQDALFQDKMVFELEGHVVAGIDLYKIKTGDIRTKIDGTVVITLPQAEILHIVIDENSKIYNRIIGILTKGKAEMETQIRNKAKEDMKNESIEAGILKSAKDNAKSALLKLLGNEIKIEIE